MFKRRREDVVTGEEPVRSEPASPDSATAALFPARPVDAQSPDTGLGVPPFRPAPSKEAPTMARPPFNMTPQSANPPPPSAGVPLRPVLPSTPPPGTVPPSGPASGSSGPSQPAPHPQTPGLGQRQQVQERRTLVVGRGISLQGVIQDAERLVVEGTVEAQLLHATDLSIAGGGIFKGEVEVDDCEVAGTMDGTVTARAGLVVRSTGRIIGTARCRRLQVEDGGQISGRIEMITEGPATRSSS